MVADQGEAVRHRALELDTPFEGLVSMNHGEEAACLKAQSRQTACPVPTLCLIKMQSVQGHVICGGFVVEDRSRARSPDRWATAAGGCLFRTRQGFSSVFLPLARALFQNREHEVFS